MNIIINPANEDLHALCCCNKINLCGLMTLDQIEDLEINLTDIIKQLQDYRLAQICGDENDIQINQHQVDIDRCQHENDGMVYCSNPPKYKCLKCGEFY